MSQPEPDGDAKQHAEPEPAEVPLRAELLRYARRAGVKPSDMWRRDDEQE